MGQKAPTAGTPQPQGDGTRHRDKAMMLAATLARMGVGLLTFILLARYLGPAPFGAIATAMAYATFIGIATDYGLATSALRRASITPAEAGQIVGDALAVKALLMLVALAVSAVAIILFVPTDWLTVYAFIFVGAAAYSTADLMMVAARANRRFDVEAKLVVSTSVAMLLLIGGIAAATGNVLYAAIAFAVTRIGYLIAVATGLRQWLGPIGGMRRTRAQMMATLRHSASYAVDNLLTTLSSQIDVLLFAFFLSAHDMGIYQSGSRLVQVIVPFAVVLSTVYAPALAAAAARADESFAVTSRRVTIEFMILAILGGMGFACVGPLVTPLLYGARYDALAPLWIGFGLFAMLRFAAASFGIQLVALGRIKARIASQLLAIALFSGATLILLPKATLSISAWLLALSALPAFLWLGGTLILSGRAYRGLPIVMGGILTVAAALVLWGWSGHV